MRLMAAKLSKNLNIKRELNLSAVVFVNMIDGVEVILRMDVIDALVRMALTRNTVQFGELGGDMLPKCSLLTKADDSLDEKLHIIDIDFPAEIIIL